MKIYKKGRKVAKPRRVAKERKINKRMKTERKGKSRQFKVKIWKTINGNDSLSYLRNPTCSAVLSGDGISKIQSSPNETTDLYVSSTAVSRKNAELDKHSKDGESTRKFRETTGQQLRRD